MTKERKYGANNMEMKHKWSRQKKNNTNKAKQKTMDTERKNGKLNLQKKKPR